MDSGLLTRALVVGFVCFILAAGGYYYQSRAAEQSNRHIQEMAGSVAGNSDGIGAIGLTMLIIAGFVAISIIAGAATTLVSANQWGRATSSWHQRWPEACLSCCSGPSSGA